MAEQSKGKKEYLIVTAHPALPVQIRAQGSAVGEAWRKSAHRDKLATLARKIERCVLRTYGGELTADGSDYGIAGSPGEFNDIIRVKTTAAGLEALRAIKEVGRISETIVFDKKKLLPNSVGTNVPRGVCWERNGFGKQVP